MRKVSILLIIAGVCGINAFYHLKSSRAWVAIKNVTIVDVVKGSLLPNQTVLIRSGHIQSIAASKSARVPKNAEIIDAAGKYLIPGLWDMHVHLEIAGAPSLPQFIAYGVTGVRDMGANSFHLIKNWRDSIARGTLIGPRIITSGPMIDGPFVTNELRITVETEAEARAAVDSLIALGVDFIKVHQQISKAAYIAVAEQAKKHQIPIVGHLPVSVSLSEAAMAGQQSIEHIFANLPDSGNNYSLLKEKGTRVTPTLVFLEKIARYHDTALASDPRVQYVSPSLKKFWTNQTAAWGASVEQTVEMMKNLLPVMLQRTLSLKNAGVDILAGTDLAGIYIFPGSSLHEELELLVGAGFTPLEALQSATINPARFLKKENTMGTVETQKIADLLILNTNPLDNISNTKDIHMVIFNGRTFGQVQLKELLR